MLALHNSSSLSEERNTIAAALTGFRQDHLIQRSLDLVTTETVRKQDVSYWIAYSFLNRFGREQTWQWLQSNWGWLQEHFSSDLSFYRMPLYAARVFNDTAFIPRYKAFFEPRMSPALERSYNQGLEMIEWHAAWKARSFKEVVAFINNQAAR
jgi:aminopeptidase 2